MKVALIVVAGSEKQNRCFWPSYFNSIPGLDHDLIVVHRNMQFIKDNIENKYGNLILENKIINNIELENKAFGAYKYYYYKYFNNYDAFGFISDDVIIKSDNWLLKSISMLFKYDKLGFVGTQIFNSLNNQYPHESHCRAPIWFAKKNVLNNINWHFNSDHEGEMLLADQFAKVGFFGAQIGNKIDLAYDALENGGFFEGDHISSLFEKYFNHNLNEKFTNEEIKEINNKLINMLYNNQDNIIINSPHSHINNKKLISEIQPFNGLIYDKSLEIANGCYNKLNFNVNILK